MGSRRRISRVDCCPDRCPPQRSRAHRRRRNMANYTGAIWKGSPNRLADLVRSFVVRDRPTVDKPAGERLPEEGYTLILSGMGAGVDIELMVAAGCTALAARLPMHTLSIK